MKATVTTTDIVAGSGALDFTEIEHAVLRFIRQNPGRSRSEIAARLGLSKSMLTKAVSRFDRHGLVVEKRTIPAHGERGQPPVHLSLNSDAFHSIGVYFRTTGLWLVRSDLNGQPRAIVERSFDGADGLVESVLADIAKLITASTSPVIGIGQVVPGLVLDDGRIFDVTPSQANLPLTEVAMEIRRQFGLPVYWENTAHCTAAYEASLPNTHRRCLFYVTLDYGIGGGLVRDGIVFRGAFNQAGNIGSLLPETGPRPSLPDLAKYLGIQLGELDDELMTGLLAAGDSRFQDWLAERGRQLSHPLAATVQLLNPDSIILGGFFPREALELMKSHIDLDVLDVAGRRPVMKPTVSIADRLGPVGWAQAAAALPVFAQLLGRQALTPA